MVYATQARAPETRTEVADAARLPVRPAQLARVIKRGLASGGYTAAQRAVVEFFLEVGKREFGTLEGPFLGSLRNTFGYVDPTPAAAMRNLAQKGARAASPRDAR